MCVCVSVRACINNNLIDGVAFYVIAYYCLMSLCSTHFLPFRQSEIVSGTKTHCNTPGSKNIFEQDMRWAHEIVFHSQCNTNWSSSIRALDFIEITLMHANIMPKKQSTWILVEIFSTLLVRNTQTANRWNITKPIKQYNNAKFRKAVFKHAIWNVFTK